MAILCQTRFHILQALFLVFKPRLYVDEDRLRALQKREYKVEPDAGRGFHDLLLAPQEILHGDFQGTVDVHRKEHFCQPVGPVQLRHALPHALALFLGEKVIDAAALPQ